MQDVVVVRAKNRMAPPLPALEHTACPPSAHSIRWLRARGGAEPGQGGARTVNLTGYRDVAVNLRVTSQQSAELGLEWHVAEVQLLLRAFADVKADDGHARYIRWRNMRGE